jgi:hypothetical protein
MKPSKMKPSKKGMLAAVAAAALGLNVATTSVQSADLTRLDERAAYEAAIASEDLETMETFLRMFPTSVFAPSVLAHINEALAAMPPEQQAPSWLSEPTAIY